MRFVWIVSVVCAVSGCVPAYTAMSQHTLDSGEHTQTDVLWVQKGDAGLYRCTNTKDGPVCTAVRTQ